jgi:protein TonB
MNALSMSLNAPPELGAAPRAALAALVLAAHLGLGWVVLNASLKPVEAPEPQVLEVSWIAPPQPEAALPTPPAPQPDTATPPPRVAQPKSQPTPVAPLPTPTATQTAAPQPTTAPVPAPAAPAPGPVAKSDASAPAEPVAAPPNPAPRVVASSALRYLDPLKPVYPRASTELCETGVVTLGILVNEWGVPVEVTVEKSSGHERLDQSALNAMRSARFKPYIEGGQPRPIRAHPTINFQLDC